MVTTHINLHFLSSQWSIFYCIRLGFPETDRSAAVSSCKESALSLGYSGSLPRSARRRGRLYPDDSFIGAGSRGLVGDIPREIPSARWTCFQFPCGSGSDGLFASEPLWRQRNKKRIVTATATAENASIGLHGWEPLGVLLLRVMVWGRAQSGISDRPTILDSYASSVPLPLPFPFPTTRRPHTQYGYGWPRLRDRKRR